MNLRAAEAYVCRRAGRPALSEDPDTETVDTVHTEAPPCHVGSRHTRRRSRRPSLGNERRRSDTSQSDRDSDILRERRETLST